MLRHRRRLRGRRRRLVLRRRLPVFERLQRVGGLAGRQALLRPGHDQVGRHGHLVQVGVRPPRGAGSDPGGLLDLLRRGASGRPGSRRPERPGRVLLPGRVRVPRRPGRVRGAAHDRGERLRVAGRVQHPSPRRRRRRRRRRRQDDAAGGPGPGLRDGRDGRRLLLLRGGGARGGGARRVPPGSAQAAGRGGAARDGRRVAERPARGRRRALSLATKKASSASPP
mmetsp:Transcript_8288/g.23383  ORF Transcript_8288/g.23383 Transcript_8288/m.23383 type:complete len:225 (+) Transcript_8288:674-1348(+)